ncbi:MAG: hypothetical protein LBF65_02220 [Holosporales bacterium]|jgi:hypothetical protein|nr:hypothetical protein [Holosporales bacterium]
MNTYFAIGLAGLIGFPDCIASQRNDTETVDPSAVLRIPEVPCSDVEAVYNFVFNATPNAMPKSIAQQISQILMLETSDNPISIMLSSLLSVVTATHNQFQLDVVQRTSQAWNIIIAANVRTVAHFLRYMLLMTLHDRDTTHQYLECRRDTFLSSLRGLSHQNNLCELMNYSSMDLPTYFTRTLQILPNFARSILPKPCQFPIQSREIFDRIPAFNNFPEEKRKTITNAVKWIGIYVSPHIRKLQDRQWIVDVVAERINRLEPTPDTWAMISSLYSLFVTENGVDRITEDEAEPIRLNGSLLY